MHGSRTPADRFTEKVDRSGGPDACWPFTAFVMDTGYGQFWDGSRLVRAHRFAFALANGREPSGVIDHTCHNVTDCDEGSSCEHRRCCNPAHLEDVTHRENVARGKAGRKSMPWKSACINGHEYTEGNQYIDPSGHQRCRTCAHQRYLNRKEAA